MSTILRLIIGITVLVLFVYLGFYLAQNSSIPLLGFANNNIKRVTDHPRLSEVALSALAMLIGLLFGAVYQHLNTQDKPIQIRSEIKAVVQSSSFFRSLLIAPLVFGGVYSISSNQPDLVVALIFAFQNGFFCEAIFRQKHALR